MSKPNHRMRGKGYYVGYGYRSIELNAKKGCLDYRRHLAAEVGNLNHKPSHLSKLKRYLERAE